MITLHDDVLALEAVDHLDFPLPLNRRERVRLPPQLDLQCIDVISVYVRVAELDDEFASFGVGDMCDHMREECVGRDVEWNSEAEVGGSLKHEAREPRFLTRFLGKMDIKLAHHMAWW